MGFHEFELANRLFGRERLFLNAQDPVARLPAFRHLLASNSAIGDHISTTSMPNKPTTEP
jgi:hypothetical protein